VGRFYRLVAWGLLSTSAVLASGCALGTTAPSRFYLLSPLPAVEAAQPVTNAPPGQVTVRLVALSLPGHLDRPQIVDRTGQNRVKLAEFDRWAEPLEENVRRVLVDNLTYLLAEDRVLVYDQDFDMPAEYLLGAKVLRMDSGPGDEVNLRIRWGIARRAANQILMVRTSHITEPNGGGGYDAAVAAMSRALGRLSQEMATALRALSQASSGSK
jgi:uncharacterized lipoprotein YmbA